MTTTILAATALVLALLALAVGLTAVGWIYLTAHALQTDAETLDEKS